MLEPSLDLYGKAFEDVDVLLSELIVKSHARHAIIVDLKGFVLMHAKALWAPKPPPLDSLATLIASNYSATAAISKLFGDTGFKEMVHQGDGTGVYIEELTDKALLVTIFDSSAVLGRVKLLAKKTAEQITEVLKNNHEPAPLLELDSDWQNSNEALLDSLFGEKIDEHH